MSESKKSKPIPINRISGKFGTYFEDEIEVRLMGTRYLTEFRKMLDSDATCGAFMLAITKIFQSVDWKPINDDKGILAKSLENINWKDKIEEVLLFLPYGFSLFEVQLQEDESTGEVTWKKFHVRPQDTINEWTKDSHGNITHVKQGNPFGHQATININKCLHFAVSKTTNRPYGRSIFRSAYRDWYYKTNIEKIESIGIERDLTGLPVLTPSEDAEILDDEGNLNQLGIWAWSMVRGVKRNEQEGLVLPAGWKFELQGSPGKRQFDLNAVISRYDSRIALSILSQFLILGMVNSSGSFALSKEQSDLFYKAVEGFAKMVANVINTQFIGTKALQLYNNLPEQPMLVPIGVNRLNLSDLASFLGRLLKFNIIQPDDKLEEHLRNIASLPEKDASSSRPADINADNI